MGEEKANAGFRSISCVVPVFDEAQSLETLYRELSDVLSSLGLEHYDICFVDDGSRDDSWAVIEGLWRDDPRHVRAVRFRRNFGKADALRAGFEQAEGEVVVTLDGDLQDDPAEIPAFLAKLATGYDLVSGWKRHRQDPLGKTLPSKVFNGLARAVSRLPLHDFNCGYKAYRQAVVQGLNLYGEFHRFIPMLAHADGFRVAEIAVHHRPRTHGKSKYGPRRFVKGLLDLLTVLVLTRYLRRPAHLFGGVGLVCGLGGTGILAYLSLMKLIADQSIGGRPLFFLGILLLLLGAQLLSFGLIAELINRNSPESLQRKILETRREPQVVPAWRGGPGKGRPI